ncbi:MAG: FMN-binding protein [Clostridiales bacterium]|nr:FMN-binding protein [Clostridiales bacterium]
MKLNVKEVARPALTLFVICFVMTLLLALTHQLTKNQAEQIKRQSEAQSQKMVLTEATSFETKDNAYAVGKNGGKVVGYVFTTKSKSYGGDISVMTGVSKAGKVTGVVILSSNDTPGLGLNAEKDSFRDQYKQAVPQNGFTVIKSGTAKSGQIEALTGATITSKAVTSCVNQALAAYQKVKGGD